MSKNVPLGADECGYAPWQEKESEKVIVRKKITAVITKEIEVVVDGDREVDDEEILMYYKHKYADPSRYIREFKIHSEGCKDKLDGVSVEGKDKLIEIYNRDIEGSDGWDTETMEIDDV